MYLLVGSGALAEGVGLPAGLQQRTGQVHSPLKLTGQQSSRMQQRRHRRGWRVWARKEVPLVMWLAVVSNVSILDSCHHNTKGAAYSNITQSTSLLLIQVCLIHICNRRAPVDQTAKLTRREELASTSSASKLKIRFRHIAFVYVKFEKRCDGTIPTLKQNQTENSYTVTPR